MSALSLIGKSDTILRIAATTVNKSTVKRVVIKYFIGNSSISFQPKMGTLPNCDNANSRSKGDGEDNPQSHERHSWLLETWRSDRCINGRIQWQGALAYQAGLWFQRLQILSAKDI